MKKLLTVLLSTILITTNLFSFTLPVMAGDISTWDQFITDFDSIKDVGGTITLTDDITKNSDTHVSLFATAAVTINTNGYAINISNGSVTLGSNITIIGDAQFISPLKVAGVLGNNIASVILNGANVIKTAPHCPAIEVGANGILGMVSGTVSSSSSAIDILADGNATIGGGTVSATGVGVHIRPNGSALINGSSTNITATGNSASGVYVDGILTVNGSPVIIGDGPAASGIIIHGGEATIVNGQILGSGTSSKGLNNMNGIANITGGRIYGVENGIVCSIDSVTNISGDTTIIGESPAATPEISVIGIKVFGDSMNRAQLNITGGIVKGSELGINTENDCDVSITGGTVIGASTNYGSGIYLQASDTIFTIDGAIVSGSIVNSGVGLSFGPGVTATINQSDDTKPTIINGGRGVYASGNLTMNGGTVEGLFCTAMEVPDGGVVDIYGGRILGELNGILIYDASVSIWGNAEIFGNDYGISSSGELKLAGGEVTSTNENAISLGSTSRSYLYKGAVSSTNYPDEAIYVEGDPLLYIYSALVGGNNINIEPEHTNYFTRQSLTSDSLPATISLKMGENKTVIMTPNGQELNGDNMLLYDLLGSPVTLKNSSDAEITSFTVTDNTFVFTPIAVGTTNLVIADNITYNGTIIIPVTVVAGTQLNGGGGGGGSSSNSQQSQPTNSNNNDVDEIVVLDDEVPEGEVNFIREPYILGYEDGTFKPDGLITRAEISTIFNGIMLIESNGAPSEFKDITDKHWAYGFINNLYKTGIIKGYNDGTFKPENNITRAEMASMMAYAVEYLNMDITLLENPYTDLDSHWAKDEVAIIYSLGVKLSETETLFKPDQKLTRAEAVVMINKFIGLAKKDGSISQSFSDVGPEYWAFGDIEAASKK